MNLNAQELRQVMEAEKNKFRVIVASTLIEKPIPNGPTRLATLREALQNADTLIALAQEQA